MNPMPATGSTFRSHSNRPPPPGVSGFPKARTDLPGGCGGSVTVVPSGRVIVTGLAAVVPEGGSSRLLRAVRRLIGTVALQAVIAACRWRRHGLDFTAWLTSEATQDPGKVEICPVRTTEALAPVSGSRQLAGGVARARQETNSDTSLLCRGPGSAQPPTWMSARNQLPRHPATRHTNLTLNSAALHCPIGPPQPVQLRRQRPGAVLQVLQVAVAAERPAVDAARPAAPVAGLRGARTDVIGHGPAGAPAALVDPRSGLDADLPGPARLPAAHQASPSLAWLPGSDQPTSRRTR